MLLDLITQCEQVVILEIPCIISLFVHEKYQSDIFFLPQVRINGMYF